MTLRCTCPNAPKSLKGITFGEVDCFFQKGECIKDGTQQSVRLCSIKGETMVVKRYAYEGFFSALRTRLEMSRPHNSLYYAHYLRQREIPCPTHYLVATKCGLRSAVAYLVMQRVPGLKFRDYFFSKEPPKLANETVEAAIHTIQSFHKLGLSHGDLHAQNLIVKEPSKILLIDLDNVRKAPRRKTKDISRFLDSISGGNQNADAIVTKLRNSLSDE
ncbi:MAG: lipopolysaccharide core heptose(II) kinase RfaY [Opitutales bacterium]